MGFSLLPEGFQAVVAQAQASLLLAPIVLVLGDGAMSEQFNKERITYRFTFIDAAWRVQMRVSCGIAGPEHHAPQDTQGSIVESSSVHVLFA